MKYTTILFPAMVAALAAKGNGFAKGKGGAGKASSAIAPAASSSAGSAAAAGSGAAGSTSNSGGANNAGAQGTIAANGLLQLPNPGPNLPVPTTFTPVSTAVPGATSAPKTTNAQAMAALQAAADNWSFDTGMVSNYLNTGKGLAANSAQFKNAANIGYNAEVDELTHKAILDQIIGNDPDVSIANQTLTNGCFQSVVDNLQIMSLQGPAQQSLIDNINMARCTQVLPSIDTYMAVAARVIGAGATLRTAIRPDACAAIVAAAPASAFPGNLKAVNVRSNTDKVTNGQSFAGAGTPSVPAPASASGAAAPATSSTSTTGGKTGKTGKGGKKGAAGAGTAGASASGAAGVASVSSSAAPAASSSATSAGAAGGKKGAAGAGAAGLSSSAAAPATASASAVAGTTGATTGANTGATTGKAPKAKGTGATAGKAPKGGLFAGKGKRARRSVKFAA
ncbi:hypothetical protein BT63DRAFT_441612 [Microthyrium microscopicum]|uniref:Uncharacterized protein n=1 Tax=Microthyrium microscopicum TaxID=703497 RepID=A0A6A6U9X7_9PEZI|nr:hypothetical protein BT63DRAFT_441612 [Microthyrium microscopicum]